MAISTSSDSPISLSMSRSDYLSTLPPWRRLLARLNWHPVYEIEQETERLRIEGRQSEIEYEQHEQQLDREHDRDIEQLKKENKRLADIESRMLALLRSADSSSQAPPATDSN